MEAKAQPSGTPPAQQLAEEESRPPSKLGGWMVALIFLAALALLIVANM